MSKIRWYVYPPLFVASIYVAHFSVDLLIPVETTDYDRQLAASYLAAENLPTPDLPFTRDGCTLWPDALFFHDFEEACRRHDITYWAGGSPERQHEVNVAFREDIRETGPLGPALGHLMYIGVEYLGDNGVSRTVGSHWGYGWIE